MNYHSLPFLGGVIVSTLSLKWFYIYFLCFRLLFESRAFGTFTVTVFGVCQCDCEEDEVRGCVCCVFV